MIDEEMYVRYKRPSKRMKERRRHLRAGASPFPAPSAEYESQCEMCDEPWHDKETCQCISLRRIADVLEVIEAKLK